MSTSIFPSSMPFDNVEIYDQSGYVEETVVETPYIPEGPIAFMPFISPRGYGEDNKLQYMNASKLAKYGKPNLNKYGLSLYLADQFTKGGGTVLGMRVTDENYAHANLYVTATLSKNKNKCRYTTITNSITGDITYHPVFKNSKSESFTVQEIYLDNLDDLSTAYIIVDDKKVTISSLTSPDSNMANSPNATITINGINTDVKLSINKEKDNIIEINDGAEYSLIQDTPITVKYDVKNITATEYAQSLETLETEIEKENTYKKSESGWNGKDIITIPLFYVAAKAKGSFANAFRVRFAIDTAMNSYISTTGQKEFCYKFIDSETGSGTKLDDAISFSFNDDFIYQDESMCIDEVFTKYTENVVMKKVYFDEFIEILEKEFTTANLGKDINSIDVLFGTNIETDIYCVDGKDLSDTEGFPLQGGSETSNKFKFNADPFASALASAFNGEKSDLIYDHVRFPYTYIFCPSADDTVISAVHNLVTVNRKCTRAHYFVVDKTSIIPKTYNDARSSMSKTPNDWKEDVISEWARITDTYTGRKQFMPSVYFTAYAIPNHWNARKGKPLAGRQNCIWTGFDVGTVTPASSNTAEYIANHNVRLNTMVEDGLGNAIMYEQITSQQGTSRLSEINNAQTLCEMVRIALKIANDNRWGDLGDDDIGEYKNQVEDLISKKLLNCYKSMNIVATRESVNGAGRNRILCKINVLFKDMLKGVTYEFYILAQ